MVVITTNVDNYHELAGSSNILHLHGEILKARSSHPKYDWIGISFDDSVNNPKLYPVGREGLNVYKDVADDGLPLRPMIVMFGETVPLIGKAEEIVATADYFLVVGTSLEVTPAANLVYQTPAHCKMYCVDPSTKLDESSTYVTNISKVATEGVQEAVELIIKDSQLNKE